MRGVPEARPELLLDGFEDDGLGEAEAAAGDADTAGFLAFEGGGGVAESGFDLGELGGVGLEEVKVGDMAEAGDEESDQATAVGGRMDFGEGEAGVGALVNDLVDEEAEVGEGDEVQVG